MARLYLFAEGTTEQVFADTVLKPHLARFSVYLQNSVLIANKRKKGNTYRGGGRHFEPMQNDIIRFLKRDPGGDVHFTTMIDLYALHNDFPGIKDAEQIRHVPYKRVNTLERSWSEETNDSRFIPFIQLHEFEAYLFTDLSKFSLFFKKPHSKISKLQSDVRDKPPELIDDGQHTSPSKRIIAQFPEYKHLKTIIGPQMTEEIGLQDIRSQCPHFNCWVTRLEKLGALSERRMSPNP